MKKQIFIVILFLFCLPSLLLAQEIRRPAIEETDSVMTGAGQTNVCTPPASGVYNPDTGNFDGVIEFADMTLPYFYDSGGLATSSLGTITASASEWGWTVAQTSALLYYGFPAASGEYSELKLNVNSSCSRTGTGISRCAIEYSQDNGTTWVALRTGTGWVQGTSFVTLSSTLDLNQLVVRVCTYAGSSGPQISTSFRGFDIWTSGTTTGPGGDPENPPRRRSVVVVK